MCATLTSGCAFVYFTVQYCREYSSTVSLFQAQDVWKRKSSSDVTGTTVLFKVLYCKIKNVFFIFCLFFTYYLCEKYYKPNTVRYYIANCVSWVPRQTLLDLLLEQNSFVYKGLIVPGFSTVVGTLYK